MDLRWKVNFPKKKLFSVEGNTVLTADMGKGVTG